MPITPKTLKRALGQYHTFASLVQNGYSDTVPLPNGESICFWDLLLGWDALTHKQQTAVFLHCILDLDGATTAKAMGYTSDFSADIVRKYAMDGLKKMVKRHNANGDGQ
jgi:hypothetical protein